MIHHQHPNVAAYSVRGGGPEREWLRRLDVLRTLEVGDVYALGRGRSDTDCDVLYPVRITSLNERNAHFEFVGDAPPDAPKAAFVSRGGTSAGMVPMSKPLGGWRLLVQYARPDSGHGYPVAYRPDNADAWRHVRGGAFNGHVEERTRLRLPAEPKPEGFPDMMRFMESVRKRLEEGRPPSREQITLMDETARAYAEWHRTCDELRLMHARDNETKITV